MAKKPETGPTLAFPTGSHGHYNGLTKREYAAIHLAAGRLAAGHGYYPDWVVKDADALLAALEKPV